MGDVFNSKLDVDNGSVVAFGGLGVTSFDWMLMTTPFWKYVKTYQLRSFTRVLIFLNSFFSLNQHVSKPEISGMP